MLVTLGLLVPASAYGHGVGIDMISSIEIQGEKISISVEMPMYLENEYEQITITATGETGENVKNVTFLVGLFHENEMIFRNYFFAEDGILPIKVVPTQEDQITIHGTQDSLLGAWHGNGTEPIRITGPLFDSVGLYSFEIEVRTIDEPTNIIDGSGTYTADLSIIETKPHARLDGNGQSVEFQTKSYFDKISSFEYDSEARQVTFEMPFDWSEQQMSHVPLVHEEVRFPKDFAEFLTPSYTGYANGIKLFKASVLTDDYTSKDHRIVHFVLLQDHLRFIKNQMKESGGQLPASIVFTLVASDNIEFPITAYTKSEDYLLNLAWDPIQIEPEVDTNFVFTVRDGKTGEPLRNSDYTFVIIQNGQEIHRVSGTAQIGGDFVKFAFGEDQTGPMTIRFENIRNTGQETEFGIVVVPEFGAVPLLVLATATSVILAVRGRLFTGI